MQGHNKEFLLFYGPIYYPYGGWKDYISSFDTEEEAIRFGVALEPSYHWFQVIQNGNIIVEAECSDNSNSWHITPNPIR